jgi:hypothetical protein
LSKKLFFPSRIIPRVCLLLLHTNIEAAHTSWQHPPRLNSSGQKWHPQIGLPSRLWQHPPRLWHTLASMAQTRRGLQRQQCHNITTASEQLANTYPDRNTQEGIAQGACKSLKSLGNAQWACGTVLCAGPAGINVCCESESEITSFQIAQRYLQQQQQQQQLRLL